MLSEYTPKTQKYSWFWSRITLVILVIVVLFVGRAVWGVYQKERNARQELADTAARHQELEERYQFLTEELERLGTEEGVEEEIRERFGLVRDNEGVVILVDPKEDDNFRETGPRGLWEKIKAFFTRD